MQIPSLFSQRSAAKFSPAALIWRLPHARTAGIMKATVSYPARCRRGKKKGWDIMELSAKKLAGELAVMAQENQLEFDFTVRVMVLFGRYAHKKFLEGDTAKDRELCEKCLREVGLTGYETRSYLSLSGGEKQRVLLARVLMQESRYIVLDEPTNHLDVSYQYQIMDILRNQDVTVFSSIHDLNLASLYCDRIFFLYQGKIVDRGTPEEVLTKENIRKYFGIEAQVTRNEATGKMQIYYLPGWVTEKG